MGSEVKFGQRLLPQIIDQVASEEPSRILYSIPISSDLAKGFRPVTALEFANAIDRTAWWLRNQLGESPSIKTIGYIGPHDLRHILLTYACVKAGYTALFLSPKNSLEGASAVCEAASCNIWVRPRGKTYALVEELLSQPRSMTTVLDLAELDDLLDVTSEKPFPYTQSFEQVTSQPFCILHTSGSTGLPKPIAWSHGLIGTMDAVRLLPRVEGDGDMQPWSTDWNDGDTIYSAFPMSHGAGIIMNILLPALFRLHCVMGPVGVIPNIHLIDLLARHVHIDIWSLVPSLVDELGENADVLEGFKKSKFICASGGPVSPVSASKVNDVIRVLNLTGTTEGLFIGNLWVDRQDWLYFAFHPYSGFEFKEVEPGVYEHWVHRNDEHASLFQGIFHTFPKEKSINLKDLYVKHPTKAGLWAYKGRNDDIVVLSNGYKISPLDSEALVTTHPAIQGCLMIGSGKAQAGLLIELKDPESGNDALFDSIWATVERANDLSLHKNQLQRDFIAFSVPDKPFIRTDKGTVKRRATLALYADYIERFYESRQEQSQLAFLTVDTSSAESISKTIHHIFGSLSPELAAIPPDDNVFEFGLDSLLAFRAVKTVAAATGLHDSLSPRHLYANPTLSSFSAAVAQLLGNKSSAESLSDTVLDDSVAGKMRKMMNLHRSRLSTKVNPFDLMNPNIYIGMKFYIPLQPEASYADAFTRLQQGLRRTMDMIPELQGRVMRCSPDEMGYKSGDICVTLPPIPSTANADTTTSTKDDAPPPLPQLRYKDASSILPSFTELQSKGFVSSAFSDDVVLECPWFPQLPADILVAQANFIKGGCILAINVHHAAFDGVGVITAMKAWAENCRYYEGNEGTTCGWLDPDSLNRSLPQILYELEGYAKPATEVDPRIWGFLGFPNPADLQNGNSKGAMVSKEVPESPSLPVPPPFPRKFAWPPVPLADGRHLNSTTFVVSAENLKSLQREVAADISLKGAALSMSDILQAFFWRAAITARYRVARELHGQTFTSDDTAIVEMPIDARPYFSSLLPSSYMGSCLVTNRPYLGVEELCAPSTSLGRIASLFRQAATRITPSLVHDAFTLLQSVPDYSMLTNACMGLPGMHCMMNNMMLFQTEDISFGGEYFAARGVPETMRVQMDRFNTAFRLLIIHPMRKDGGVELLLGTLQEEMDMLMADEEFMRYAEFVG